MLRKRGVVGKFVEFFGNGCQNLTIADRATIANMAPEYGATCGFFPVDSKTIDYLKLTSRKADHIDVVEKYLRSQGMFRLYDGSQKTPTYSGDLMKLDLNSVQPSLSGPKRPHDRVDLKSMKSDFTSALSNPVGFKGYGLKPEVLKKEVKFTYKGEEHVLKHGSLVIAAITSCTNTSNPDVMLAAGILARNAVKKGLKVKNYIKCSLSPGSGVVTKYFNQADVSKDLDKLGFTTAGYGCMTCIGNSGDLPEELQKTIQDNDLVASAVLSGNRNFEGRVHQFTRANYLASPPLVVAYALAGRVDIDFDTEPIGKDSKGKDVFLREIWPTREEVSKVSSQVITPEMFKDNYEKITDGNSQW